MERAAMTVHALTLARDEFGADPEAERRDMAEMLRASMATLGVWPWVAALGTLTASQEGLLEVRVAGCAGACGEWCAQLKRRDWGRTEVRGGDKGCGGLKQG